MADLFVTEIKDAGSGCGPYSDEPIFLHYSTNDRDVCISGTDYGPYEMPLFYGFLSIDGAERLGRALIEIARQAREHEGGKK